MFTLVALFGALLVGDRAQAALPPTPTEAKAALRKAVDFFQNKAGYRGAYLYKYSADLKKQEGEGLAYKTTGWTQPPGQIL